MTTENADIDAIRQRADEYEATMQAFKRTPLMSSRYVELIDEIDALRMSAPEDRATLLAHVDEQAERVRTLEAENKELTASWDRQVYQKNRLHYAIELQSDILADVLGKTSREGLSYMDMIAEVKTMREQAADAGNGGA